MHAMEQIVRGAAAHSTATARGTTRGGVDPVMRRQLQRLEQPLEDLAAFFGGTDDLVVVEKWVTLQDFLMAQRALAALLDGWRVTRTCSYDGMRPALPDHHAVPVAHDAFDFAVRDGTQFWEGPDDARLVLELELDEDHAEPYSRMRFCLPRARHDWLRGLLPRMEKWMDAHHVMRNQAIDAAGNFLQLPDRDDWADLLLPEGIRETLERHCLTLLAHRELFRANGVPLRRGILLHGKPGTGKTMIGRALARRSGVTFILATPGMLCQPRDVKRVFAWARRFAPTILFFEDFDMVASERGGGGGEEILGEFLAGLDGLDTAEGIIAIATTNDLDAIEPALKDRPNRFDVVLEVPPLSEPLRAAFLRRWADGNGGGVDIDAVARRANGFTGAQLQELCRLAAFEAIAERIQKGDTEARRVPLAPGHFDRAFAKLGVKRKRTIGFDAAQET